jgi:hypothetical protein
MYIPSTSRLVANLLLLLLYLEPLGANENMKNAMQVLTRATERVRTRLQEEDEIGSIYPVATIAFAQTLDGSM